jgi:hypothetical protein
MKSKFKVQLLHCFYLIGSIIFLIKCNSKEEITYGLMSIPDCKSQAAFISNLGMNTGTCAFSTSEKKSKGVVLIDANSPPENRISYQDSSWKKYGNMGPLAIAENGNTYVAPVPFVNVMDNKREDQNKIYVINSQTGVMSECINLGTNDIKNQQNAFGIMGLFYDCENKLLYASSIYGSDNKKENGVIYCLDVMQNPAKIIDQFNNIDAIGVGIARFNEKKRLFFGSARDHGIHSIELKENGGFTRNKRLEFSLNNVGPRGDDVGKKIRFTDKGEMLLSGMEFYYNLTAPTQKQESVYTYTFDLNTEKWIKLNENNKNLLIGF